MRFEFLKHSEITKDKLRDIIFLKNIHWSYSEEEHLDWIVKNLNLNDIHVLVYEELDLVAYLNLTLIDVLINNNSQSFLGIGNVCSKEKGLGYGRELLIATKKYFLKNNYKGILFCKDELVAFYEKFGYTLICKNKIVSNKYKSINIMVFNENSIVNSLEYNGRVF